MKKVLFFTQNRWAFGSIHHSLCKELYKNGIYANLLDYDILYSQNEFDLLLNTYDYFVTQPDSIPLLINYKVPTEKIVTVAHAEWDINIANLNNVKEITNNYKIHNYGVISQKLFDIVNLSGYDIKPKLVTNGIHFDMFYSKPSSNLSIVGFGGKMENYNFKKEEIKRGELVQKCVADAGLHFKPNGEYHYLAMPGYYKSVDAIVMSSTEEACGLPMLEAAAAGKLCIGTPVGYFKDNVDMGGGVKVRIEKDDFITDTTEVLQYYKVNTEKYQKKCLDIQEYARYNYDWKHVIDSWIQLF
jgi:glycosyltransferase involved in cell wall biosynthesis